MVHALEKSIFRYSFAVQYQKRGQDLLSGNTGANSTNAREGKGKNIQLLVSLQTNSRNKEKDPNEHGNEK